MTYTVNVMNERNILPIEKHRGGSFVIVEGKSSGTCWERPQMGRERCKICRITQKVTTSRKKSCHIAQKIGYAKKYNKGILGGG